MAAATLKFYSLDVETANPDQSTICQIGIGIFEKGQLKDTWKSFIDPKSHFHWRFIDIHGITPQHVKGKPTFTAAYPTLKRMFENNIVVHHSPFDKTAFMKAFYRFGLPPFEVKWLDSVKVARHAFGDGRLEGGYNLANVAAYLDIDFQHHDALEDSITCGKIALEACRRQKVPVDHFYDLFK